MASAISKAKMAAVKVTSIKEELEDLEKIVDQMSEKSVKCLMVESFNQIQLLQERIDATSQQAGLFCEQTNDAQAPALWEKVCMETKESKSRATSLKWKLSGLIKDESILDKTTISCKPKKDTGKKIPKVKHREFDTDNTELWFKELELRFEALEITSEISRFIILTGLLDEQQALTVAEVTEAGEDDPNPYTHARRLLQIRYSTPWFEMISKAFNLPNDMLAKPSESSAKVEQLLRNATKESDILHCILKWDLLRRIPRDARKILATEEGKKMSLEEFRNRCDELEANSKEAGNIELEREKSVNAVKPVDQTTKRQGSKG